MNFYFFTFSELFSKKITIYIEYPVINGRTHPEIIHCLITRPSATTPLRIDAWENIQRDPNDIRYGYIWHVICKNFSNFMPLFGVSRKKICGTEQKLKSFKNHETSAQKLSLMSNIQSSIQMSSSMRVELRMSFKLI